MRMSGLTCSCLLVLALLATAPVAAQSVPAAAADTATAPAPATIAHARDQVMPVVVSIMTVREDFQQGEPVLSVSSGSGTVVSAEGHIATNAHVTQKGRSFRVVFGDGRELPARLVGTDTLSDLAVLQALPPAPEKFAYARFAETLDVQPGDTVLAMGAPWGLSNSMSAGVVNNPRRLLVSLFDDEADYEDRLGEDEPTGRYYAWIQHDAAIAPGNSGGPLVDLSGRIVGVNTRGMIFGGDLAFAIPGPDAGRVVASLIRDGRVMRAALGFRLRSLKGTGHREGVLVNAVERASVAEKAGLRPGDRILRLAGERVDAPQPVDVPALQRRIAELPIGSEITLDVDRGGKATTLKLVVEAQPRDRGDERAFAPFGISVLELTPSMGRRRNLEDSRGLLVTGLRPGGPAAIARPSLVQGDLLRQVDGKPVSTLADLQALAGEGEAGKPRLLEYTRNSERRIAVLVPEYGDRERTPLPELPKAWAGAEVQPLPTALARDAGFASGGFRIVRLYPEGPLAKAGGQVGDLLTSLDDTALRPANETSDDGFQQRVRDLAPGTVARFSALRAGKAITLEATLVEAPASVSALRTLALGRLRAQLRELGFFDRAARRLPANLAGVIVDGVETGGPAGLAHLRGGDVVVALGGRSVASPGALAEALEAELAAGREGVIPLQVIRGGETRILYLERYWLTETP